jgi:hypothetical protein
VRSRWDSAGIESWSCVAAVLFQTAPTRIALTAGVDQAPHSRAVAPFKLRDLVPDCGDDADDLVPRHEGLQGHAETVADEMNVGVAHAAMGNLDVDIMRAGIPPGEREGHQCSTRLLRGEGLGRNQSFGILFVSELLRTPMVGLAACLVKRLAPQNAF